MSVSQSPADRVLDTVLDGLTVPLCVRPGLLLLHASFALLAVEGVLLLLPVPLLMLGLPVPPLLSRCRRRANCVAVSSFAFGGPMLLPPTLLLFPLFPAALRRDGTWGLRERARLDTVELCEAEAAVGPARRTRVAPGVRGPLLVVSVVAVAVEEAAAEVSWWSWRLASSSWVHWARTVAWRAAIVCFASSSSFCLRMATLRKELVLWWGRRGRKGPGTGEMKVKEGRRGRRVDGSATARQLDRQTVAINEGRHGRERTWWRVARSSRLTHTHRRHLHCGDLHAIERA